jgi:hypothetical protein
MLFGSVRAELRRKRQDAGTDSSIMTERGRSAGHSRRPEGSKNNLARRIAVFFRSKRLSTDGMGIPTVRRAGRQIARAPCYLPPSM